MIIHIACIIFVCVTANHLGLIAAIENVIGRRLIILNCPKCLTYWAVAAYVFCNTYDIVITLAMALLASYIALWLELAEGIIDILYLDVYEKITTTDTKHSSAADNGGSDAESTMPDVRKKTR